MILEVSTNRNNLSLWRNYAKGDGYNFGISLPRFLNIVEPMVSYVTHAKVLYDEEKQVRIIALEIQSVLKIYSEGNIQVEDCVARLISNSFTRNQLFFKDPAFRHDEEYRIVFRNIHGNELQNKYKTRNGYIVLYIEIPLSNDKGKQPIVEINISPMNRDALAKKGLEMYINDVIQDKEIEIPINYSLIPVRF